MNTLASRINRRIVIEQPVRSSDGAGGFTVSWQELATVWAAVRKAGGAETTDAAQRTDSHRYEVTMRYRNDVHAQMRLKIDGVIYEITRLQDPDGAKAMLELRVQRSVL